MYGYEPPVTDASKPKKKKYIPEIFYVFLTVYHSIDLFQDTNLMHTSFIL